MEQWPQDFVDAEVSGYIEFCNNGRGSFQFGYVRCEIDWSETGNEVEFTSQARMKWTLAPVEVAQPKTVESWSGNSSFITATSRSSQRSDTDRVFASAVTSIGTFEMSACQSAF